MMLGEASRRQREADELRQHLAETIAALACVRVLIAGLDARSLDRERTQALAGLDGAVEGFHVLSYAIEQGTQRRRL